MHRFPLNDLYPCIQGEGCMTGTPMVLVRLHGCAVGCPFCDTKETWDMNDADSRPDIDAVRGTNALWCSVTGSEINQYIADHFPGITWVLVTGGEPAQYPLQNLVTALHDGGHRVALETSGTEVGHLGAGFDWVCVSPKLYMPGGKLVQSAALAVADEIKHAVGRQRDIDNLLLLLESVPLKSGVQICLQPISQSSKATRLCIETVQRRNWRLSLQIHKFIQER